MLKMCVVLVSMVSFFSVGCTKILARLVAPEFIAEVPIILDHVHTFQTNIDFKAHTKHRDNMDKVGPYKIGIKAPELKDYTSDAWAKINARKGLRKDGNIEWNNPSFTGKIVLEWTFSNGVKERIVCDNSAGTINEGIGLVSFWLRESKVREVTNVSITIERVDSLVAQLLSEPKLVIYRGGGK
jgi:hypothetical protein